MDIIWFLNQLEILIAIATKKKSYPDAMIALEFRLLKLILLIKSY